MKLISLLALYFLMQSTFAATYYFSATDGDDNRMATQAQNSTTPWKTLGKLNAIFSSLKPGDKVLLKRGDTFVGSIYPNVSGTAGLPILISAYGTGNKPVISGLTTLTNWMSLSNGIWENADPGFGTSVNVVLINGVPQNIGRYPNISSTNGGYLTFESHNSTNSITDNQLTATTNWTGGEVVIRKVRWVLDRNIITSHTTNTLNYTSASVYQPVNNFGYFIQNHPKTLDLVGEWYFNSTLKKLGIYFKTDSPSSYTIKASQVKNLVALYNQKYISLDNLKFEGANEKAIDINNVSDITIKNCEISFSGINAITGLNSAKIAISNSIISNTNNNAVILYNCSNSAITDNNISNTGAVAGMGQSGDGNYNAISIEGSNNLIQYNQIKNTGYIPIYFEGSSTIVQNNFIDRYAFIKDDAGGIYLFNGPSTTTTYTGRKILANIILNGIGTPAGTDNPALSHACGIFLDNKVSGVEIRDNTMANAANKGILILYSNKVIMKNNTLYNNKIQLSMRETNSNQVYNNIFFSKLPTQIVSHIDATKNDIGNYGSFDSNYYARPMDDDMVIYSAYVNSTGKK